jgi:ATP-dependent DNA helicase RecQ
MEQVLIVAKTRMGSGICIGGLALASNRSVRLLPRNRYNLASHANFEVGQVWDLDLRDAVDIEPPHLEDVVVCACRYRGEMPDLRTFLLGRVQSWYGGPECLFDEMLTVDQTKCYVARSGPIPKRSTGYWLPDRILSCDEKNGKPYYLVDYLSNRSGRIYHRTLSIPFVGFATPLDKIFPNTLVRVSLARWLSRDQERCYLQISGWYI